MQRFVIHPFSPVYNADSRILILGTIPSPKSIENAFYYSHPQNEFWHVIADITGEAKPESPEEKTIFLLNHHIALWDVLKSCDIKGASDSDIKNPIPNDFTKLLAEAPIEKIFTTGKKAYNLYTKLCAKETGRPATYLPSTSPANRKWFPYPELFKVYKKELENYL